ncbi:(2Fe-2S)-binding protein [Geothrix sp. 21YS21S-4]|uniref:(2Fe-2S)-binding protein n=1 Tax=Geothrix sp. 21YS21S-4 TaxID=3068889 RepID=UPI0027B91AFB|nr:(2Fe-2S)-binding protein [Geothrix sp. 21YS21S-4]
MPAYQLTVNGRVRTVDADADTPLLWILRDNLGLTGTKFGCGQGVCGSCVVHLDGKAARSCQTPIKEAAGHSVVTVEGLSKDGSHPVQKAWLAEDVSQCGYCQPGMIMTAAALLKWKARPTDGDIDEAFADHICRCGTYPRVRKAVKRAAGGAK